MAQWVMWDDVEQRMLGMVRNLPESLQGRDAAQLAQLGYRELVTVEPETSIKRFPGLLGSAVFTKLPDGRVQQSFPDADFSVKAVKAELKQLAKRQANQELSLTDWYVLRKVETGEAIPAEVTVVRESVRKHVAWIEKDIDAIKNPRALVDYKWMYPKKAGQQMVLGVPVVIYPTEPPAVEVPDGTPPTDEPLVLETGDNIGLVGATGDDETLPDPPPPPPVILQDPPVTTDGPVPHLGPDERPEFIDANGMPLVTVYAPRVPEDEVNGGKRPANDQD